MGNYPDFTRAEVERATLGMLNAFKSAGFQISGGEFYPKTGTVRILRDESETVASGAENEDTPPLRKWG